jgi:hypothetical protein
MTTFVLVHGGFGSPAELVPVIPELEALGHRAIAVDLPCPDPHARGLWSDGGRRDKWIHPPIVVGHSAGVAAISLVPARTRVDRLVYVTAVVPEPGRSIADIAGTDVRETILSVSHDDGNGCRSFDWSCWRHRRRRAGALSRLPPSHALPGLGGVGNLGPAGHFPTPLHLRALRGQNHTACKQRAMASSRPIEIASEHAVFALQHASRRGAGGETGP